MPNENNAPVCHATITAADIILQRRFLDALYSINNNRCRYWSNVPENAYQQFISPCKSLHLPLPIRLRESMMDHMKTEKKFSLYLENMSFSTGDREKLFIDALRRCMLHSVLYPSIYQALTVANILKRNTVLVIPIKSQTKRPTLVYLPADVDKLITKALFESVDNNMCIRSRLWKHKIQEPILYDGNTAISNITEEKIHSTDTVTFELQSSAANTTGIVRNGTGQETLVSDKTLHKSISQTSDIPDKIAIDYNHHVPADIRTTYFSVDQDETASAYYNEIPDKTTIGYYNEIPGKTTTAYHRNINVETTAAYNEISDKTTTAYYKEVPMETTTTYLNEIPVKITSYKNEIPVEITSAYHSEIPDTTTSGYYNEIPGKTTNTYHRKITVETTAAYNEIPDKTTTAYYKDVPMETTTTYLNEIPFKITSYKNEIPVEITNAYHNEIPDTTTSGYYNEIPGKTTNTYHRKITVETTAAYNEIPDKTIDSYYKYVPLETTTSYVNEIPVKITSYKNEIPVEITSAYHNEIPTETTSAYHSETSVETTAAYHKEISTENMNIYHSGIPVEPTPAYHNEIPTETKTPYHNVISNETETASYNEITVTTTTTYETVIPDKSATTYQNKIPTKTTADTSEIPVKTATNTHNEVRDKTETTYFKEVLGKTTAAYNNESHDKITITHDNDITNGNNRGSTNATPQESTFENLGTDEQEISVISVQGDNIIFEGNLVLPHLNHVGFSDSDIDVRFSDRIYEEAFISEIKSETTIPKVFSDNNIVITDINKELFTRSITEKSNFSEKIASKLFHRNNERTDNVYIRDKHNTDSSPAGRYVLGSSGDKTSMPATTDKLDVRTTKLAFVAANFSLKEITNRPNESTESPKFVSTKNLLQTATDGSGVSTRNTEFVTANSLFKATTDISNQNTTKTEFVPVKKIPQQVATDNLVAISENTMSEIQRNLFELLSGVVISSEKETRYKDAINQIKVTTNRTKDIYFESTSYPQLATDIVLDNNVTVVEFETSRKLLESTTEFLSDNTAETQYNVARNTLQTSPSIFTDRTKIFQFKMSSESPQSNTNDTLEDITESYFEIFRKLLKSSNDSFNTKTVNALENNNKAPVQHTQNFTITNASETHPAIDTNKSAENKILLKENSTDYYVKTSNRGEGNALIYPHATGPFVNSMQNVSAYKNQNGEVLSTIELNEDIEMTNNSPAAQNYSVVYENSAKSSSNYSSDEPLIAATTPSAEVTGGSHEEISEDSSDKKGVGNFDRINQAVPGNTDFHLKVVYESHIDADKEDSNFTQTTEHTLSLYNWTLGDIFEIKDDIINSTVFPDGLLTMQILYELLLSKYDASQQGDNIENLDGTDITSTSVMPQNGTSAYSLNYSLSHIKDTLNLLELTPEIMEDYILDNINDEGINDIREVAEYTSSTLENETETNLS
jgi:hypothetical protein